jgi:hypothetical protein
MEKDGGGRRGAAKVDNEARYRDIQAWTAENSFG